MDVGLPKPTILELWSACEHELGLDQASRYVSGQREPFRRIYVQDATVIKVEFFRHMVSSDLRSQDVVGEYHTYRKCDSVTGVARAIRLRQRSEFNAIYLERIDGRPLCLRNTGWLDVVVIVFKLAAISVRLAKLGVAHNDIVPANILVCDDGAVTLIDFDQANMTGKFDAVIRNIFGVSTKDLPVHGSIFKIVKVKSKMMMPKVLLTAVRKLKAKLSRDRNRRTLPALPPGASTKLRSLLEAWRLGQRSDANAPGLGVAYYALEVDGVMLPGERPWIERWSIFSDLLDYRGKRILELGCNMGLLSTYLLAERGAVVAFGTDHDETILESARMVASAFDVDATFEQVDFDADGDWEAPLVGFKPDVVFALNVLNWLKDKDRFLRFLGQFSCLVFEGHDSFEVERDRLRKVGFSTVELICVSERSRPIMICKKGSADVSD